MSGRERQLWTEFVCKREASHSADKPARKQRAKKPPLFTPAELEAALDDLTTEGSRSD
jgi:hypothetical protein